MLSEVQEAAADVAAAAGSQPAEAPAESEPAEAADASFLQTDAAEHTAVDDAVGDSLAASMASQVASGETPSLRAKACSV